MSSRFYQACSVIRDRETDEIMAVVAGGEDSQNASSAISGTEVLFQGSNDWEDWMPLPIVRIFFI